MSDIDIEIDINGVKKVGELLEDGVEAGAEEALDKIVNIGQRNAKSIIVANDLVWTSELYRSIKTETSSQGSTYSGQVFSDSPHAPPIEFGAEYDASGPPISSLLPWVKTKLADWNIDRDGDGIIHKSRQGDGAGSSASPSSGAGVDKDSPSIDEEQFTNIEYRGGDDALETARKKDFDHEDVFYREGEYSPEDYYIGQSIIFYDKLRKEHTRGTIESADVDRNDFEFEIKEFKTNVYTTLSSSDNTKFVSAERPLYRLTDESFIDAIIRTAEETTTFDADPKNKNLFLNTVRSLSEYDHNKNKWLDTLKALNKFDDKHTSTAGRTISSGNTARSVHATRIRLRDQRNKKDEVLSSTIAHELQHARNKQQNVATHYDREYDKQAEYKSKGGRSSQRTTSWYFLETGGSGKGGIKHEHQPAGAYFLAKNDQNAQEQFDKWHEYVEDEVQYGLNGMAKKAEFDTSVSSEEVFFGDTDASAGDYLSLDITDGKDPEYQIESLIEREDSTTAIIVATDGSSQAIDINSDGSIISHQHTGVNFNGYAEGSSVDDSDPGFVFSDPDDVHIEALNRAWYRQAIASEEYRGDYDEIKKSYLDKYGYSSIGAHETTTKFREIITSDSSNSKMSAVEYERRVKYLIQFHPKTILLYNGEPSEKFKKQAMTYYSVNSWQEVVDILKNR